MPPVVGMAERVTVQMIVGNIASCSKTQFQTKQNHGGIKPEITDQIYIA